MIFKPKPIGRQTLDDRSLEEDRKNCKIIGPCGIGREALYLNSFYFSRRYYVRIGEVARVFKRIAMSRGGFTKRGPFGALPYLVVVLKSGEEKQCKFKKEEDVDRFLEEIARIRPSMPLHSREAEKKLRREQAEEEARYKKDLSKAARASIDALRKDQDFLEERPSLYRRLAYTAKEKRIIDNIDPTYQIFAGILAAASIVAMVFGVYALVARKNGAIYFLLFGAAFLLLIISSGILPLGRRNKRAAQREVDEAVERMKDYLASAPAFFLPPQYAHPVVIRRMIRVIREGRCETREDAFELMKQDLKALNSSVTVSQREYDEVVLVKPMFLVHDYR